MEDPDADDAVAVGLELPVALVPVLAPFVAGAPVPELLLISVGLPAGVLVPL